MRVYISGKITGDRGYKQKFRTAELTLLALGHEVLNPAEGNEGLTDAEAMRRAVGLLLTADAIYMLPDWMHSPGAMLERELAKRMGLEIGYAREEKDPSVSGADSSPCRGAKDTGDWEATVDRLRGYVQGELQKWRTVYEKR